MRRCVALASLLTVCALAAPSSAESSSRDGVSVVASSLLIPAFVIAGEYGLAPQTTLWFAAGAGSTRATYLGSEQVRRALVTGAVGARRYFHEFLFGHADATFVHVSGERDEVIETTSAFTNRARQLAALYVPGLSLGAGIGAVIPIQRFYIEIGFCARWVVAKRSLTADAPNVTAHGAIALIPAIAIGLRL